MTAAQLRRYRQETNLTQRALALQFGVTANTIARWERGEVRIPPTIPKLIQAHRAAQNEILRLKEKVADLTDMLRTVQTLEDFLGGPSDKSGAHQLYKRLARKYHPDRNQQNAEFMSDLNELYQTLK